jgi:hypothetical protein
MLTLYKEITVKEEKIYEIFAGVLHSDNLNKRSGLK